MQLCWTSVGFSTYSIPIPSALQWSDQTSMTWEELPVMPTNQATCRSAHMSSLSCRVFRACQVRPQRLVSAITRQLRLAWGAKPLFSRSNSTMTRPGRENDHVLRYAIFIISCIFTNMCKTETMIMKRLWIQKVPKPKPTVCSCAISSVLWVVLQKTSSLMQVSAAESNCELEQQKDHASCYILVWNVTHHRAVWWRLIDQFLGLD